MNIAQEKMNHLLEKALNIERHEDSFKEREKMCERTGEREINGNNKCHCIFIVNRLFDFFLRYVKDLHKEGLSLSSIVYGLIPGEKYKLHSMSRIAQVQYILLH